MARANAWGSNGLSVDSRGNSKTACDLFFPLDGGRTSLYNYIRDIMSCQAAQIN